MEYIVEAFLIAGVLLPVVLILAWYKKVNSYKFLYLFFFFLLLDAILTPIPYVWSFKIESLQWNWEGKFLSMGCILLLLRFKGFKAGDIGLHFKQKKGSILPSALVTITVIILSGLLISNNQTVNLETILYQATMPGIAEELVYRGVLLACLGQVFDRQWKLFGASVGWGLIIVSLAFGLLHGLGLQNWAFTFNFTAFLFPFIGSLIFGWLRLRSGSLLFPILAHNGANLIGYVF